MRNRQPREGTKAKRTKPPQTELRLEPITGSEGRRDVERALAAWRRQQHLEPEEPVIEF
jgi:hypothetical protein